MARIYIPLTQTDAIRIENMAGFGLTVDKIAVVLRMSKKTLERRLKETPEAKDALERGRARAERDVAETAYRLAISGKCPAMTMFFLKCRAGWREVERVEITDGEGKPVFDSFTKIVKNVLDAQRNTHRNPPDAIKDSSHR